MLCLLCVSLVAAPPPLPPPLPPPQPPGYQGPNGSFSMTFTPLTNPPPPGADRLGDVWEVGEVSDWKAVWIRRGRTRMFDGYWTHYTGERIRAELEMWQRGNRVTVVRRHPDGQYCRYDGRLSDYSVRVTGSYTCTWARTPMHWEAQVVHMSQVMPAQLRRPTELRR